LYKKNNRSLGGLSFQPKWSQPQPTTSLHDYAYIKGALELINTTKIQDFNPTYLRTCVWNY